MCVCYKGFFLLVTCSFTTETRPRCDGDARIVQISVELKASRLRHLHRELVAGPCCKLFAFVCSVCVQADPGRKQSPAMYLWLVLPVTISVLNVRAESLDDCDGDCSLQLLQRKADSSTTADYTLRMKGKERGLQASNFQSLHLWVCITSLN